MGVQSKETMALDALRSAKQSVHHPLGKGADELAGQGSGYARDQPLKALLIAATFGALLMGLITFLGRRD